MGTIKPAFWKTNFIISPNEFEALVQFCCENGLDFYENTYGNPKHDIKTVCDKWKHIYEWLTVETKPEGWSGTISYSLHFYMANGKETSFTLFPREIQFPYYRKWAETKIEYLMLSCCKGFQVDKVDEKGAYFIYEDINLHEPELYPKYEKVSNYVKGMTKPFRFKTWIVGDFEEFKSLVRISEKAASDIRKGWIFKEYQLEMLSFT
jgi:hypothetical protein